jgi:glycosidase
MKRAHFLASFVFIFLSSPVFSSPWWQESVIYEIFVRSFQDSNRDGIGDLRGIIQRLDYLKTEKTNSLGVNALWLSPVFPSPSYHGYDVVDYRKIHPEFGSLEDFNQLIQQSHFRGIKIILDLPVNHSSSQNPWFLSSQSGEDNPYRPWYLWRQEKPLWGNWFLLNNFYYYSFFSSAMPQLNWKNLNLINEVKSILDFWIQKGVDGFRLDAARYYVPGIGGESDTSETHQAIQNIVKSTKANHPETLFLGEIWADSKTIASYFPQTQELDLAFSFPLSYGLIDSLNHNSPSRFFNSLLENKTDMPSSFYNAPFLTNHDVERIASQLNGDEKKLILAASCLMALPGTPVMYFGEEIGMRDGVGANHLGDLAHRLPMQWNLKEGYGFTEPKTEPWQPFLGDGEKISVEAQEKGETLLNEYKKLIAIRNSSKTLRLGEIEEIEENPNLGTLSWKRVLPDSTVLFVANFSPKRISELDAYFSKSNLQAGATAFTVKQLYGSPRIKATFQTKDNLLRLRDIPPFSSVLIDLKNRKSNL